jgi:hypothetical protein
MILNCDMNYNYGVYFIWLVSENLLSVLSLIGNLNLLGKLFLNLFENCAEF